MIDSILLVPADGDPHGLLADGVCGARVPWAYHEHVAGGVHQWTMATARSIRQPRAALVLAYQGKPVAEGCYRVLDTIAASEPGTDRHGFPKPLVAFVNGGFGLTFGREGRMTWNARDVFGTTATFTTPTSVPATDDGPPFALALAMVYVGRHPSARLVFLDADGREVTP